jgi:hypothetical protein
MKTPQIISTIFLIFLCSNTFKINSKFINNLYHSSNEIYSILDNLSKNECSSMLVKHTMVVSADGRRRNNKSNSKNSEKIIDDQEKKDLKVLDDILKKMKTQEEFIQTQTKEKSKNLKSNSESESQTKELIYYSISGPNPHSNQQKAYMIFGEHSRELISPEQGLYLIQVLCGVKGSDVYTKETIQAILQKIKFYIVPIVNVYGRKVVQEGDLCKRTNENNVDLNRNWPSHWKQDNRNPDENPGSKPFSEWQTRALRNIIEEISPNIFITTHSGNLGMYTPFAYKKFEYSDLEPKNRRSIKRMLHIIKRVNRRYCNCTAGSIGNELGYLCPGTCLDYAFESKNVKYSFAFEIFDGDSKNENYLKLLNDPNLKGFNYQEFIKGNKSDKEFHASKSFLQLGMELESKTKNKFLSPIANDSYEKLSIFNNGSSGSCFSQTMMKTSTKKLSNDDCKSFFPFSELHFKNTLINWTNVYFEIFALVGEYES